MSTGFWLTRDGLAVAEVVAWAASSKGIASATSAGRQVRHLAVSAYRQLDRKGSELHFYEKPVIQQLAKNRSELVNERIGLKSSTEAKLLGCR